MIIRNVIPAPRTVLPLEGELRFGRNVTLRMGAALTPGQIEEVRALWHRFCMRQAELTVEVDPALPAASAVLMAGENALPDLAAEDEYALTIDGKGAYVSARDASTLLHGLFTLLQLIVPTALGDAPEFALPAVTIHDHPAIGGMRAIHLCVFPETTLLLLEKAIRMAGLMKFTHVVLEFWGMLRYDTLPELAWPQHAYTKEQIKPLIRLIRDLGMEVIPMLNHLGHATQSRVAFGRHVVLDQNPGKALLFEPDGWTWCLSNPETLRVLSGVRRELIELCGPGEYFHLGCDESYSFATCPICAAKDKKKLLADYLNGLAEELGRQGRRAIIWGDQLLDATVWKRPNIATSRPDQRTHEVLPLLDRRIVIADWQYGLTEPEAPTLAHFIENGFDAVLCPWDGGGNNEACAAAADRLNAFGVMATTWDHLPTYFRKMPTVASALWHGAAFGDVPGKQFYMTEAAALLRRAMPNLPAYHEAGWISYEVEEFDETIRRNLPEFDGKK